MIKIHLEEFFIYFKNSVREWEKRKSATDIHEKLHRIEEIFLHREKAWKTFPFFAPQKATSSQIGRRWIGSVWSNSFEKGRIFFSLPLFSLRDVVGRLLLPIVRVQTFNETSMFHAVLLFWIQQPVTWKVNFVFSPDFSFTLRINFSMKTSRECFMMSRCWACVMTIVNRHGEELNTEHWRARFNFFMLCNFMSRMKKLFCFVFSVFYFFSSANGTICTTFFNERKTLGKLTLLFYSWKIFFSCQFV